jgi:diguanylate cyclase (GGDEF)-like protein
MVVSWVLVWFPFLQSGSFPVLPATALAPLVLQAKNALAFIPLNQEVLALPPVQWLPGFVDWVSLLTLVSLAIVRPLANMGWESVSNVLWVLLTERSFSQKKETLYKDELKARSEKLRQLTLQYRNLDKTNDSLKQSVIMDELTGTYNKRFYVGKLNELFIKQKNNFEHFAVVMLDIDYFKKVNDTYGHLVGDDVLKAIAKLTLQHMPQQGLCCRFGGEEFAVLLPGVDRNTILQATNNLRLACPTLVFESAPELRVTLSAGIACINFADPQAQLLTDAQQVVKLADDELYRAKLEGRNRICFMEMNALGAPPQHPHA